MEGLRDYIPIIIGTRRAKSKDPRGSYGGIVRDKESQWKSSLKTAYR
jgi:hypothetical protein